MVVPTKDEILAAYQQKIGVKTAASRRHPRRQHRVPYRSRRQPNPYRMAIGANGIGSATRRCSGNTSSSCGSSANTPTSMEQVEKVTTTAPDTTASYW